jgi:hypothetical protein
MCAGVLVVAAFFLPWLRVGALAGPSGWSIAREGEFFAGPSGALWLVPIGGLCLLAAPALGQLARLVTACAGAAIATATVWIVVRPLVPLEGGLAIALLSAAFVLAGDLLEQRVLRMLGAVGLAGSFLLDWFGRSGLANTQPAPCPHTRVTVIPWGVVIAGCLALASALAPRRLARLLARLACALAALTVLCYVIVAYDPVPIAPWATIAAGVVAALLALVAPRTSSG